MNNTIENIGVILIGIVTIILIIYGVIINNFIIAYAAAMVTPALTITWYIICLLVGDSE